MASRPGYGGLFLQNEKIRSSGPTLYVIECGDNDTAGFAVVKPYLPHRFAKKVLVGVNY